MKKFGCRLWPFCPLKWLENNTEQSNLSVWTGDKRTDSYPPYSLRKVYQKIWSESLHKFAQRSSCVADAGVLMAAMCQATTAWPAQFLESHSYLSTLPHVQARYSFCVHFWCKKISQDPNFAQVCTGSFNGLLCVRPTHSDKMLMQAARPFLETALKHDLDS